MNELDPVKGSESTEQRFLPVAIDSLDFCALEMDLYLRNQGSAEPTLYRAAGVDFTPQDAKRLSEQGVKFLQIGVAHHAAYRRMLAHKLEQKVLDPAIRHQERWKAVRASCDQMITDVLLLPGRTEAVDALGDISRAFAEWSCNEECGFSYMLDMSSHDFYTTSHMVNVGVGCGLLVKELKPDDSALFAVVVQGGMLHDAGKRGIPESILNKEGKLDPEEWSQMQKHPTLGYEELKGHPSLPDIIPLMARDHHERLDGKGYPNGIRGDEIGFAARICAVVDVYDAITAARPYRGPVAPADALEMMREGRGTQFDPDIFDAWAKMIERLVKDDPERAVKESAPGAIRPLDEVFPRPLATPLLGGESVRGPVDPLASDRRRSERKHYPGALTVAFVRQGKRLPIALGEPFSVNATDLSTSGVGFITPWPLSLDDILWVQFPTKGKVALKRFIQVVRVRRARNGLWLAGCCFIQQAAVAA